MTDEEAQRTIKQVAAVYSADGMHIGTDQTWSDSLADPVFLDTLRSDYPDEDTVKRVWDRIAAETGQ